MLIPGASAPDIQLPDLDGDHFNLREALSQGPVLVVFFKVSCPTCQMTFPYLQRLADALSTNAQIIAISQDDAGDSREFHQRVGVSMRTLIEAAPGFEASNAYGIDHVPSMFLIEQDGTISLSADGFHKLVMEHLGGVFGIQMFGERDAIPDMRPG